MSELAPRRDQIRLNGGKLTLDQVKQIFDDPFLMLTPAIRRPSLQFWMFYSHMKGMDQKLAFCTQLATWIDRQGVEPIDILRAFKRMTDPAVSAKYRYSSDLLADLGALVADERRTRREKEETAARRNTEPSDSEKAKVRAMLDEFMDRTKVEESGKPRPKTSG